MIQSPYKILSVMAHPDSTEVFPDRGLHLVETGGQNLLNFVRYIQIPYFLIRCFGIPYFRLRLSFVRPVLDE